MSRVDHLSPSQVRRSRICLRLLQYEVIERKRSVLKEGFLARGTAVHAAVEADCKARIKSGRYLTRAHVAQVASDAHDAEAFFVDWKACEDDPGKSKDDCIKMALAHHRTVAQEIVPLAVEYTVTAPIAGVPLPVTGRIDILSERLVASASSVDGVDRASARVGARQIRDCKTSKASVKACNYNDELQLVTYWLAAKHLRLGVEELHLDYLWPADQGRGTSLPVVPTQKMIDSVVEDYTELANIYRTGLFPRTGRGTWKCALGRCAHYDYCILGPGARDA